jgi:hypothetical protein
MTEAEWLGCEDPAEMLGFLRTAGKKYDRKMRLLAVACCRSLGNYLKDERSRTSLEAIELFADGLTTKAAVKRARQSVRAVRHALSAAENAAEWEANWLVEVAGTENAYRQTPDELRRLANSVLDEGPSMICFLESLIRDIFGNPFRPLPRVAAPVLSWNDGCVVKLAAAAYEGRDYTPQRMGVLADALEEAGLTDEEVLKHCRQGGAVHVAGCWCVDLLLGKS